MLPMTLALGGLVAALVFVLPLEATDRTTWLVGSLVSALIGALAMVIKTQLSGDGLTGTAAMKALITAQGLTFMLRLIALGVGALAVKQAGLSPMTFVVAFFLVSLSQQVLETRSLLSARHPVKSSEVTS